VLTIGCTFKAHYQGADAADITHIQVDADLPNGKNRADIAILGDASWCYVR
jgi:hypothetical protein